MIQSSASMSSSSCAVGFLGVGAMALSANVGTMGSDDAEMLSRLRRLGPGVGSGSGSVAAAATAWVAGTGRLMGVGACAGAGSSSGSVAAATTASGAGTGVGTRAGVLGSWVRDAVAGVTTAKGVVGEGTASSALRRATM
jgi:hypothetical protein